MFFPLARFSSAEIGSNLKRNFGIAEVALGCVYARRERYRDREFLKHEGQVTAMYFALELTGIQTADCRPVGAQGLLQAVR
jgi:hypothetical protein